MKNLNIKNVITIVVLGFFAILLQSCNSSVGGNEDNLKPSVVLTSLNNGEEVIGDFIITWNTIEENRSKVDILLSYDSGQTYKESDTVVSGEPDIGSYLWKTNDNPLLKDCRNCKIRIIATDVVGNTGEPVESAQDFIINNIPQVLGVAYYFDLDNNGPDGGDEIRVPFDKDIEIRTSIASDIFFFPVLGDNIGPFSTVRKVPSTKDLIITMGNNSTVTEYRIRIRGSFKPDKFRLTDPSGINLQDNISEGIIFSPDTGRTAAVAELGIDILSTYSDSGQVLGSNATSLALGDVDGDGDLDMVLGNPGNNGNRLWLNGGDSSGSNTGIFIYSGQVLGSNGSRSIIMGDIDGDGDLDIVVGNYSSSNRVWINGGDNSGSNTGVFTDSSQALGNSNTNSIVLGDVDGDGDLDMVVGNFNEANRIWFNGGDNSGSNTGLFADSGQTLGTGNTSSIALDDVDGDGDLDIVAGNGGVNRLWINQGGKQLGTVGEFIDSGQTLGSGNTNSIALGDVDGDGDLDMVAGNFNEANRVWLNNINNTPGQEGVFTDSGQALGINNTNSIALSDVDRDGDLDMVVGKNYSANEVWLNGGDSSGSSTGLFTNTGQVLGSSNTRSIGLGDVDGDGDPDMVVGNNNGNSVWLNSLKHPSTSIIMLDTEQVLGSSDTRSVALGDVDGDGDLDIMIGNGGANRVWFNGGDSSGSNTGVFTDSGQALGTNDTRSIALGDVDGDGDLDLMVGNSGANGGANRVWLNGGDSSGSNTGIFTDSGQVMGTSDTRSIALSDVDGDGDLDMVVGNSGLDAITNINDGANRVWFNGGDSSGSNTGVFTDSGQALGTNDTRSIALGDVDGDGDLDLVVGNSGANGDANRVWLNGGDSSGSNTGIFTDSGQALGYANTQSIALGDVDGDGDLDMVVGDNNGNSVLFNGGDSSGSNTGIFTDSGQALGYANIQSIALGDVDSDGDLDMIVGDNNGNSVLFNGGDSSGSNTGVFTDSGHVLGNSNTPSIALGDVDGDGDLDMVVGNIGPNRIWLNDY